MIGTTENEGAICGTFVAHTAWPSTFGRMTTRNFLIDSVLVTLRIATDGKVSVSCDLVVQIASTYLKNFKNVHVLENFHSTAT